MDNAKETEARKVQIHIPFVTIVKLFLFMLFLVCLKVLGPLMMTLFLAILLAVSLDPVVCWLEKRGIKRGLAVGTIALILVAALVAVVYLVVPALVQEISNLIENLPKIKEQLLQELSESNPIRPLVKNFINTKNVIPKNIDMAPIISVGNVALSGLTEVVLIFVFAIYLVIDGRGVIDWLSAFFAPKTQGKITQTGKEVSLIIYSYVAGQLITSLASFFYVWAALSYLQVPSALLLATLAGLFDVLPVLGFFFAVIPAMIFAATVSSSTAIIVLGLYIFYHGIENYFIVPAVYGSRLRVSSFSVLLTLIAAGLLAGVEGAIAALPIVASYPIIERIWLKKLVGQDTVTDHQEEPVGV